MSDMATLKQKLEELAAVEDTSRFDSVVNAIKDRSTDKRNAGAQLLARSALVAKRNKVKKALRLSRFVQQAAENGQAELAEHIQLVEGALAR